METDTKPERHILYLTLEAWLDIGKKMTGFVFTEEEILEAMSNKTGLIAKRNGWECYLITKRKELADEGDHK